ncbi:hypothetical protein G6011_07976 [Alternaria panax]|uniref:Uncharacterized protein n=1 Tax=Alternaria panax TaxID=48097 RepID=A0AAD4F937_9PLEO|nr:hypothetical protein G6011_07976 [Alternaria panax]
MTPPSRHHLRSHHYSTKAELGGLLNWTGSSLHALAAYRDIGDYPRDNWLNDLGFLFDKGTKASLVDED